jgi:hypothetical protein
VGRSRRQCKIEDRKNIHRYYRTACSRAPMIHRGESSNKRW